MADSFEGRVTAWVATTKKRMLAVRNGSAQRVVEIANTTVGEGGNLPFRTGFLRASGKWAVGEPNFTVTTPPKDGGTFAYDATAAALVLTNAKLDDVVSFVWTAAYARRMNYGFVGKDSLGREYNQKGYKFRDLAVQQWGRVVQEECVKAKASVEGRA